MPTNRKHSKLKKLLIVVAVLLVAFFSYVEIINRNSVHMTYRQKILKALYPAFVWWTNLRRSNTKKLSNQKAAPMISFYSLQHTLNDGTNLNFAQFEGKKVLLVNTASDCGYTGQYEELERLHQKYQDKLVMIAFPANDFGQQEKGDDNAIATFCKKNYGVSFLLMKKSSVIKGPGQNEIYQWLTDPSKNGWNDQPPTWNFCKYLIDEHGKLTNFFASSVEPLGKEIVAAIESR